MYLFALLILSVMSNENLTFFCVYNQHFSIDLLVVFVICYSSDVFGLVYNYTSAILGVCILGVLPDVKSFFGATKEALIYSPHVPCCTKIRIFKVRAEF